MLKKLINLIGLGNSDDNINHSKRDFLKWTTAGMAATGLDMALSEDDAEARRRRHRR